jgi:integrase
MTDETPKRRQKRVNTDADVRALKPKAAPYKRGAGRGLYIFVSPAGGRHWRYDYKHAGKRRTLTLGSHPEVDLTAAIRKRENARAIVKAGGDPGRTSPDVGGMHTFAQAADAWLDSKRPGWADSHYKRVRRRIDLELIPTLGKLPIGLVKRSDVKAALDTVAKRGAVETARRVAEYASNIFKFCEDDRVSNVADGLRAKLPARPPVKSHKKLAIHEIGPFLYKLDAGHMEKLTRLAILLTLHTAARTSEVIGARWIEFEKLARPADALWRIPGERMKKDREHLIPLSTQAIEIIEEVRKLTGKEEYLFPKTDGRPGTMSNNSMLFALYGLGYRNKSTIHGFRGSFSTIANESGLWKHEWVEMQLAHLIGSEVSRSYNSALYLDDRRRMMSWWSDKLAELKENERFGITEVLR